MLPCLLAPIDADNGVRSKSSQYESESPVSVSWPRPFTVSSSREGIPCEPSGQRDRRRMTSLVLLRASGPIAFGVA